MFIQKKISRILEIISKDSISFYSTIIALAIGALGLFLLM